MQKRGAEVQNQMKKFKQGANLAMNATRMSATGAQALDPQQLR